MSETCRENCPKILRIDQAIDQLNNSSSAIEQNGMKILDAIVSVRLINSTSSGDSLCTDFSYPIGLSSELIDEIVVTLEDSKEAAIRSCADGPVKDLGGSVLLCNGFAMQDVLELQDKILVPAE